MDSARAHAAALAGLRGMTPVRLARLLGGLSAEHAWEALRAGTHPGDPRRRFIASARATDVEEVGERYVRARVSVLLPHTPGYPRVLAADPGGPAVLFALGDPSVVEHRPRVAIAGTASPTRYGLQVASEMAAELADGGVAVVSGLSVGIDAAAHAGVVRCSGPSAAPPDSGGRNRAGPTASPPESRAVEAVAAIGVVFSEAPLGASPGPGGCGLAAGSSPDSPTWWWWSRATETADPSPSSKRPLGGPCRSAPYRAPSAAGPRTAPTSCWSTGALRCGTPLMSWSPSIWPESVEET